MIPLSQKSHFMSFIWRNSASMELRMFIGDGRLQDFGLAITMNYFQFVPPMSVIGLLNDHPLRVSLAVSRLRNDH